MKLGGYFRILLLGLCSLATAGNTIAQSNDAAPSPAARLLALFFEDRIVIQDGTTKDKVYVRDGNRGQERVKKLKAAVFEGIENVSLPEENRV